MLKKSTPYFSYLWAGLMAILVLFFLIANIASMFSGKGDGGIMNWLFTSFWVLLIASPALLKIWATKKANQVAESINTQISKIFGSAIPRFNHFENNSVIMLHSDKSEILLANPQGVVKTYPYSAIREWEIRAETAGEQSSVMVTGTSGAAAAQGAMMGISAAMANSKAQAQAAANTGLYISVKDIDYPEWRISMASQSDRKRWFEILNQAINEGGVA